MKKQITPNPVRGCFCAQHVGLVHVQLSDVGKKKILLVYFMVLVIISLFGFRSFGGMVANMLSCGISS